MMIREDIERNESETLSRFATLSCRSKGRQVDEDPCTVRTCFQHDRDRILHSKSFRRLKYKTQVFLSPEGDHYRTRMTHTLEVAQIARTLARAMRLNEDLTEAIALGHDLGHTPFGHAGEKVLDELVPGGFRHERQSLRVIEQLEKNGQGLNLTFEVRDGVSKHSKGQGPIVPRDPDRVAYTLEGQLVRVADVIAYINHDLDDALRAGLVRLAEVPAPVVQRLGERHSQRIHTLVCDLINESLSSGGSQIRLSAGIEEAVLELRRWLFDHVYRSEAVQRDFEKAAHLLRELFAYFMERPEAVLWHGGRLREGEPLVHSVADFIAGMTDRFALSLYQKVFMPQPWRTA